MSEKLTFEQNAVVKAPIGNICCFAVAGSGKTTTLIHRAAYLLKNGIPMNEILLISFSAATAKEMSKRINYLAPGYDFVASTFHSFGLYLCRRFYKTLNLEKDFMVLDGRKRYNLMNSCRLSFLDKTPSKNIPKTPVLIEIFSGAINHNMSFEEYIRKYYKFKRMDIISSIEKIFTEYVKRKSEGSFVDFDDLLLYSLDLLSNTIIKKKINSEIKHILVDEYQDINWIQFEILKLLNANNSLFVIGDSEQAIYGFRGASDEYMKHFMTDFDNVQSFYLSENFRSTSEILSLAESSINNNKTDEYVSLISHGKEGTKPIIFDCKTQEELYTLVAEDIVANHFNELSDVAVLVRYNQECSDVQRIFEKAKIPCINESGILLTSTKYFQQISSFLAFLNDPLNKDASKITLSMLGLTAKNQEFFLKLFQDAKFSISKIKTSNIKIKNAIDILSPFFERDFSNYSDIIKEFINSFYEDYVYKNFVNPEQILEDIDLICEQSTNFKSFLDFMDFYSFSDESTALSHDCVNIITIHKAKGLEWKYVYVLNVNDDYFPKDNHDIKNERKLFYVACTRAMDELFLGFFNYDSKGKKHEPSIFLEELNEESFDFDN